jgi:hypothetical protein
LGKLNLDLEKADFKPRPSWNKASDADRAEYKEQLEHKLSRIRIPEHIESCRDLKCKEHEQELNEYCEDILKAIDDSAGKHFLGPSSLARTRPSTPYRAAMNM